MKKAWIVVTLAIVGILYNFRLYKIDGTSMNYGLLEGDLVLTYRHFDHIRRGDILVFQNPKKDKDTLYIKRCVALPGDRFFEKGRSFFLQLESNSTKTAQIAQTHDLKAVQTPMGVFLKDPYLKYYGIVHNPRLSVPEVLTRLPLTTLHADTYYLLGDYRDNSEDSRFFGPVPRESIFSKVIRIYKKPQAWRRLIDIKEAESAASSK